MCIFHQILIERCNEFHVAVFRALLKGGKQTGLGGIHGNCLEERDFGKTWGKMSGNWYLDGEGCQGRKRAAVIIVRFLLVPAGSSQPGARCACLLPTYPAGAAPCPSEPTPAAPPPRAVTVPACHSPVLFSLRYIIFFFVPGAVLLLSLPFDTYSLFIITNVILAQ